MNPSQDIHTPFIKTSDGLVAQNDHARILLSSVHGNMIYDGNHLIEATECNCLVRPLKGQNITLYIDDQPAETLGFLRDDHTLWGRLTTGDRPGHIRFRICANNSDLLRAELEIRPSRLDYETDYQIMRADLEDICRELVYLLPAQTRITTHLTDIRASDLDFRQVLDTLLNHLVRTLHAILKRPDRRLSKIQLTRPIDRTPGRDPDAITHLIRSPEFWTSRSESNDLPHLPLTDHIGCTHLRETHRHSSINTPLNRHLVAHLKRLFRRAQTIAHTDLGHRLKTHVNQYLRLLPLPPARPNEPLPVHIDARYQTAFALIRDLNRALAPCTGGPFDLSYRDTPTLYEYWTYFTLVHTLCDLGFAPTHDDNLFRLTNRGLTVSPTQGESSAIHLQRDNCHIRCLYNPTYTTSSGRALTHNFRPDIVIEIHTPKGERTIHAFDAKYRREDHNSTYIPLREDIDKMHAYRDAIGQVTSNDFQRTLQSAIVLFPAPTNPAYESHPFHMSLPHGIGGLPLLPGDPTTPTTLRKHITQNILP